VWDRYDVRDDSRGRDGWDRDIGGRGARGSRAESGSDSSDVFTRDVNLPRRERRPVADRDRIYEIDGVESRIIATVGAFRVVAESDLSMPAEDARQARGAVRHLEHEGLVQTSPLTTDDRAVVLTARGRDLLEANRRDRDSRAHAPQQAFYAGLRKPRELTHDTRVYRAYQRAEERLRSQDARIQRVVLDYELKRDYQQFLHERNRGRKDSDGRPDREPDEVARWARENQLPYGDGHVEFPDARIEYEDRDGLRRHEDLPRRPRRCRRSVWLHLLPSCARRGGRPSRERTQRSTNARSSARGGVHMTPLPTPPDRWTIDLANTERLEAVAAFGFTERQARFLVQVLLHAGVFVERQFCRFSGIVHGQKSTDFIKTLVERRFATPISTGRLHRGRMLHVHYKPLWEAIGEPDSRFRKPAALGRMIERVMLLDAVLDDPSYTWLGPAVDKRRHFMRYLGDRLPTTEYPRLMFGNGPEKTVRQFPDKLPIGTRPFDHPHVLVYLVIQPSPMDFRLFLLRHTALLRVLVRWTIRLLIPRQLSKAALAYQHAAREHLASPLRPSVVTELEWYFGERKGLAEGGSVSDDKRFRSDAIDFREPRFQALYRQWLDTPVDALWMAQSTLLADAIDREFGTVECVQLSRQYLHLSPLVDVA
jgi:hypothetical protein